MGLQMDDFSMNHMFRYFLVVWDLTYRPKLFPTLREPCSTHGFGFLLLKVKKIEK